MFVYVFIVLVAMIASVSFFDSDRREKEPYVMWMYAGAVLLLFLMAGFRPIGIDNDSNTYLSYYEGTSVDEIVDLVEPSFTLIAGFARLVGDARVIFVIYALLAIPLMAAGLVRLSCFWFLSLLIWSSHYFLIQDMTQIRVAVSTAAFIFSLKYLIAGQRWRYLGWMLVACFFHFSAILLVPFALLTARRLTTFYRLVLCALPLLFYGLYVSGVDILVQLPIPLLQEKLELYEMVRDQGIAGDEINVFNAYALIRLFTYYMLLWKYDIVVKAFEGATVLLKIMCFSICFYAGLAFLPALAIRGSEVCGVVDIVLIPCLVYTVKPAWAGRALVALFGLVLFFYNIYVSEYLKFTM